MKSHYDSTSTVREQFVSLGTILLMLLVFLWSSPAVSQDLDVPYVPTPSEVVDRMLQLANVGSGDYVIDLGSGDGRIVIAAAEKGAVGHGVDLNKNLLETSRQKAQSRGVDGRVMFIHEDLFKTDISDASVITMYLLSKVNIKLRPRLLEELRPGTRIVSHSFDMDEWEADSTIRMETAAGVSHRIYLWIIPADADGRWNWEADGTQFRAGIKQNFQELEVDLRTDEAVYSVNNSFLKGNRISFMANSGDTKYVYSGHIEGGNITGNIQIRKGNRERIVDWSATRE